MQSLKQVLRKMLTMADSQCLAQIVVVSEVAARADRTESLIMVATTMVRTGPVARDAEAIRAMVQFATFERVIRTAPVAALRETVPLQ